MKQVKIETDKAMKGYVVMNIPSPKETAKLARELTHKNVNGQMVEKSSEEQTDFIYDLAEKHCVEVNLVNPQGAEFKSIEDLGYDEDGRLFMQEMAGMVIKGVKLSPKSLLP